MNASLVKLLSLLMALALVGAACSTDTDPETAQPETTGPATETTSPEPAGGGWIGGEPDWFGSDESAARASGLADDGTEESGSFEGEASTDADAASSGEPMIEPAPATTPPSSGPLRAGSVDDNDDYAGYLDYLSRVTDSGIRARPFDPSGRVTVSVVGSNGRPVAGQAVTVTSGDEAGGPVTSITTTADGTANYLPAVYGQDPAGTFAFQAAGQSATANGGDSVTLTLDAPGGTDQDVALDVLFLLDATGSMGDEIDQLKTSIDSVAERVDALEGSPDVRFAMTLYRDTEDSFLTRTHDFTGDVESFRSALAEVRADGGGDYPEALDEGLADALGQPAWREAESTIQLVFLVADAPPQVDRPVDTPYTESIQDAISRGIKIFPVASSNTDDRAELSFRHMAQATGARFVFLSYGAGGAATGGSTDIDSTDYEELSLDDLVVRLVAEEIAAQTGDAGSVPTPEPQPDPNPGQED